MANYSDIIYDLLSNDATIASYVGDRIYPVAIEQGAVLPAITYRKRVIPDPVKGLPNCQDTMDIDVTAVGIDVDQLDAIQQAVRSLLDKSMPGSNSGFTVGKIHFVSQDFEEYSDKDDVFLISSKYTVKIKL